MKKIVVFLFLIATFISCYDDYIKDFDINGVYFSYQLDVRTFVVGEGMEVQVGVALAGTTSNSKDRTVGYQIDNSLVNASILTAMKGGLSYIKNAVAPVTELKQLPSNYFTVSDNSKFVIKKGENSGAITVRPDSIKFLNDAATLVATYVLPLRITNADTDTILVSKNYSVIGLKYENMLFGNYWHGGVTVEKNAQGNTVKTTNYFTSIPSPDSKAWALTTVEPFSLVTNGFSDIASTAKPQFKITLNGGNITVSSVAGATYQVQTDGISTYNQAKLLQNRRIFLSYKYQIASGNWCYAKDTLTFRNRFRDGVNEWQDENPAHY